MANSDPDGGADVTVAEQLSPAVAANVAMAPEGPVAFTSMGPGQTTSGGSTSFTVTVKLQVDETLGNDGLAVCELTDVVPTANALPAGGVDTAVTSGHIPSTFGAKLTTALHLPGALFTVIGAGHSIVGAGSWKFGVSLR